MAKMQRKSHGAAIINLLDDRGPQSLRQIVGYLKTDNTDRVEYDLKVLKRAGSVETERRLWQLTATAKRKARRDAKK